MTPKTFLKQNPSERVASICKAAGTPVANFRQIAYGGSVGKRLAEKLAKASGYEMTELEILYPERYQPSGKTTARTINNSKTLTDVKRNLAETS